jgi:hypothetical protein
VCAILMLTFRYHKVRLFENLEVLGGAMGSNMLLDRPIRFLLSDIIDGYNILKSFQIGRPINVQFLGDLNLPKLYKQCTPEQHWQTCLVIAESLTREVIPATTKIHGRQASSVLVILDLKGFGYVREDVATWPFLKFPPTLALANSGR